MQDLSAFLAEWGQIVMSGLTLIVAILGGGWATTYLQVRRERKEWAQERRDALEASERKLFMFVRAVLARQVFRGPYRWTSDPGPFDQAMADTLLALETGFLQTRTRRELVHRLEVDEIASADPERQQKLEEIKGDIIRIQNTVKDDRANLSDSALLLFRAGDLKHCGAFVWHVKHDWGLFAAELRRQFSSPARQMLDAYPSHQKGAEPRRLDDKEDAILVEEINRLLTTQQFEKSDAIASLGLATETTEASERRGGKTNQVLVNRLVLRDAFPATIPPLYVVRIDRLRNEIVSTLNAMLPALGISKLQLPRDTESRPI